MRKCYADFSDDWFKIKIMVDAYRVKERSVAPVDERLVDMIRVATYVKDIDKAIDLCKTTKDIGYETTVNIMAVPNECEPELIEALHQLLEIHLETWQ